MKAIICWLSLVGLANATVLVDNSEPRAAIVVAANNPQARQAAQEIQTYVAKISGATLPIVNEGEPVSLPVTILVGHKGADIPAGFNPAIRPDVYEEEGYVLKTTGNQIVVAGNSDGPYQGTLYAAYALLETLGCRWYFPGEWGEVVPEMKTVTLPALNVKSKPDFAMRGIWLNGRWRIEPEDREVYKTWSARVGFSGHHAGAEGMYPGPGDGHLGFPIPPKEYAQSHPEFFAMDKTGKRNVKPESDPQWTKLCLSNDEMIAEYIKNVGEAFAGKRSLDNVRPNGVGLSPPDGAPFCYCTTCLAASQNFNYPTYIHERMQSEELFGLGGKLADAFPDKWVSVSAYALRELPPQGVKLRPNMAAMYAPISSCVLHPGNHPGCWRRQETMRILEQWCCRTPHVWLYDYNHGFLITQFVPERDVANFAVNAPLYKKIGLKGFAREGSNAMMASWISYYTAAKLMWDVNADVAALKQDLYNTFFGPDAGPHVQAWWDACEEALGKATVHVHEDWLVNHIYTADFARSIHPHVEAARQATMTGKQRERFKIFELIVENFEASTEMEAVDLKMDYRLAAACAARMLAAREALHKISVFLIGKQAQEQTNDYFTRGRMLRYESLAAMIGGEKGVLIAPLPLETKNTFYTWDAQDQPEDAVGYGWYRFTVDVPAEFKDQPAHLYLGGIINEGWVWVNGEYAGHRLHKIWVVGWPRIRRGCEQAPPPRREKQHRGACLERRRNRRPLPPHLPLVAETEVGYASAHPTNLAPSLRACELAFFVFLSEGEWG